MKKIFLFLLAAILSMGLVNISAYAYQEPLLIAAAQDANKNKKSIRGNRNSKIYHLPQGCPSYNKIAPKNIVNFNSEEEAKAAGYRKAKNCR